MSRLPQPGADDGQWGDILNDYLLQSHNADGSVKDDVVGTSNVQDGAITEAKLDSAVATKLNSTTDVSGKADKTTTITGAQSITGGGDLSTDRTLSLVGDSSTPGNDTYYGTDGTGTKGFYSLPASGVQSVVAGNGITVDNSDSANPIVTATAGGKSRIDDPNDTLWAGATTYDEEFTADTLSLPSGWSWVNQGSATYDQKFGCGIIDHPGVGSGDDIKLLVRSLPAGASWTATAKVTASGTGAPILSFGLALRESATGKFVTLGMQNNGANSSKWNSPTSYNSAVTGNLVSIIPVTYFRIIKNNTTSWDLQLSADGIAWWKLASANNLTTFLTGTIDQIGFFAHRQSGAEFATALHWFRVR